MVPFQALAVKSEPIKPATIPSAMDSSKIDHCVETISLKGCTEVWEIIAALERNQPIAETADLLQEERQAVLAELKSIMAVYQVRK